MTSLVMKIPPHSNSNIKADFQGASDFPEGESTLKTSCVEASSEEGTPGGSKDINSSSEDTPHIRSVTEEIRECVLIFDAEYQFRYSDYTSREPNGFILWRRCIFFLNYQTYPFLRSVRALRLFTILKGRLLALPCRMMAFSTCPQVLRKLLFTSLIFIYQPPLLPWRVFLGGCHCNNPLESLRKGALSVLFPYRADCNKLRLSCRCSQKTSSEGYLAKATPEVGAILDRMVLTGV